MYQLIPSLSDGHFLWPALGDVKTGKWAGLSDRLTDYILIYHMMDVLNVLCVYIYIMHMYLLDVIIWKIWTDKVNIGD